MQAMATAMATGGGGAELPSECGVPEAVKTMSYILA